ncbi:hypothetical protein LTR10_024226 [Elasticomyces elasticus]|uniref:FAD-binding domain-containing protein n=1 Tax=Exophiala sideris TaxID=1016849 RepID=A0ABR0J0N6_9EURO|nr:hypothetical protein LTR10_024226 [Elasticomyces elasticus]KAK5023502.1 hypothetical protein LTS07_009377 [Exophiala sideris]KAK5028122.1 hypothetical protein LTR13_009110 [Exophiala sideris]KAK5052780.1 hypothetical protein LTR69_009606 [Exophiala sideris]KAK5178391.1 hypothetical protein LTR44_009016 [Eurotiomycetes sp. CCFEE 6388]
MTAFQPSGPNGVAEPKSSGIKVIIVGLGLGGLLQQLNATEKAIRSYLRSDARPEGDSIAIVSNAAKTVSKWVNDSVHETLKPIISELRSMDFYDTNAELFVKSKMFGYTDGIAYPAHRGDLAMVIYKHAEDLDIEIHLGSRVTEYCETDNEAGIVVNGQRKSADCVIGADGVHSKARGPMTDDPETRWLTDLAQEAGHDLMHVYLGKDMHFIFATAKYGKEVNWMCTHLDTYDVEESLTTPGDVEDMLKYVEDWPCKPRIEALIRKTPKGELIDHKLLWRDPLSTWVSPKARMMVIGDAAHPFNPTAGQGGVMAIEDAGTLAIALELAGKQDVHLALRATQMTRACLCQKLGVQLRNAWHQIPWEDISRNNTLITLPKADWLYGHDPQAYAYDEYKHAVAAIKTGRSM